MATALRTARTQAGLTQSDLAKLVGLTKAAISRYESGLRRPPLDKAIQIARVFDQPVEDLFDLEEVQGSD